MEATEKRKIENGDEFDHLFPAADKQETTVQSNASVDDTVQFIPKVVYKTLHHTRKIAKVLKAETVYETCQNIWDFVYKHIAYAKDEKGLEQIRSPGRSWYDRKRGVDCDCYTVFISSILTNLKIPHHLRITKYKHDHFQHIYPIVPTEGKEYITIDCVVNRFNYEEPYTEKKDTNMDLQYLSGLDAPGNEDDFSGLFDGMDDDGLGKKKGGFLKKIAAAGKTFVQKSTKAVSNTVKKVADKGLHLKGKLKIKDIVKAGLHVANKLNPTTVLLRNGILASLKLNLFKVSQRLKYAYMSDAEAQKRGADMGRLAKVRNVKDKLEAIFFSAGGQAVNFRKAILTGKGNKSHEVSGFGELPEDNISGMSEDTPLEQLLGDDIYRSENVDGMEEFMGFGELGEPATAASITAASSIIASISAILKSIGSIFKKKDKEGKDFEDANKESDSKDAASGDGSSSSGDSGSGDGGSDSSTAMEKSSGGDGGSDGDGSGDGSGSGSGGFWDKNKKWLKPTLIGAGGLGLLVLGYKAMNSAKKKPDKPLSGAKSKKGKSPKKKKEAVALM